ncbi:MAG: class I SAM-dependent methyltransferase [Clostridiales Family XIII bacterium]|jgi:tRNA (cmo5U34)-methyltransferase|nr:class I SAM-dependent methyltransferase [Clostridiales Family XIII bacterium]
MDKADVKKHFDEHAEKYDRYRRMMIPRFDDFYETGIRMLRTEARAPRVLDLGAGTGLYSSFLLKRYPAASITLLDFSEDMLAQARKRFDGNPNITCTVGEYSASPLEENYDIVLSALSIHHLGGAEKAALCQKIYAALNDGGEFVNADQIISPDPGVETWHKEQWVAFIRESGMAEEELEKAAARMRLDTPSTVGDQLKWLADAGFAAVDCPYKYLNFAVFYARKAGKPGTKNL